MKYRFLCRNGTKHRARAGLKRFTDVCLSATVLILLSPLLLIIGLLVAINLGRPILFVQVRPGLGARPFRMYKFRTMTERRTASGNLLEDSERLTAFGQLLRSTSLDELPELWNVLIGDMSLVGPRPLLTEYVPLYSREQARRMNVRPGITGWAQVNGRNAIGWQDRFALDTWYIDNQSLWLDWRILWKTIAKVFFRQGISAEGEATMTKFQGNDDL